MPAWESGIGRRWRIATAWRHRGGGVAAVLGNEVVGGNRHAGAAADNLRAVMVQQIAGAGQRDAVTRCIWCCR